jgi:hypothetical protein
MTAQPSCKGQPDGRPCPTLPPREAEPASLQLDPARWSQSSTGANFWAWTPHSKQQKSHPLWLTSELVESALKGMEGGGA